MSNARNLAKAGVSAPGGLAPTGVVLPFAGAAAPTGWLLCDGATVSRTTYATLFASIGTTYGAGDGSTTFALPDLKGRVPAGKEAAASRLTSAGSGVDGSTLGATGGAETHTLSTAQMPSHGHPTRISTAVQAGAASSATGGLMLYTSGNANYSEFTGTPSTTAGQQIGGTGGGNSHNNTQPTIVLNYIIKT